MLYHIHANTSTPAPGFPYSDVGHRMAEIFARCPGTCECDLRERLRGTCLWLMGDRSWQINSFSLVSELPGTNYRESQEGLTILRSQSGCYCSLFPDSNRSFSESHSSSSLIILAIDVLGPSKMSLNSCWQHLATSELRVFVLSVLRSPWSQLSTHVNTFWKWGVLTSGHISTNM